MKKLCYVSAFINLNRFKWKNYSRTFADYLQMFLPQIEMFKNMSEKDLKTYSMCLFIDEYYFNTVRNVIPENLLETNITMIKCNYEWLLENTILWNRLEYEREIMNSSLYKQLYVSRMTFPENTIPEYTIMNHSKVDLIDYAMKINDSDLFCWIDFGYFKEKELIPKNPIDISLIDTNTIHYFLVFPITEEDKNIVFTMLMAPEIIQGGVFVGTREILTEYRILYHTIHQRLQDMHIVDDDQHIALRCYFERPEIFTLRSSGEKWCRTLVLLQKRQHK